MDEARRAQRLADMYGGGNVVTLSSTSSMDEDGITEMAMQRINIILKVGQGEGKRYCSAQQLIAAGLQWRLGACCACCIQLLHIQKQRNHSALILPTVPPAAG